MTYLPIARPVAASRPRGTSVSSLLKLWGSVIAERRAIDQLDAHLLADIGISRARAHQEAKRPFWAVKPRTS